MIYAKKKKKKKRVTKRVKLPRSSHSADFGGEEVFPQAALATQTPELVDSHRAELHVILSFQDQVVVTATTNRTLNLLQDDRFNNFK